MPRFAANLTMLWPDLEVYDRFRAAAEAGFRRVEILFVHALDAVRVEKALQDHELELVLFDPAPGDWARGERGLLSVPGREQEFVATVRDAVAAGRRFGTKLLNVLAGIPPAGVPRADVPGGNQPGTGTQPIGECLRDLDESGYRGSVGLEYRPRGTMEDALAWLPRAERG